MPKSIRRVYNFSDDKMLERAEVFADALTPELADFTARFPWLDGVWLTAFQSDVDAADAFPKDESTILDIKVLTGDVGSAMQQGHGGLQTLGAYAKLAWPKDLARQRVFGQDRWSDAYYNTLKLQEALELAHAKANNTAYQTPLIDKGYTQPEIDELETLSDEIKLKNRLQEAAKSGRKVSVHDRVALLNVVWHHMQTISTCADVVWASDAERLAQYQLYPSTGGSDSDPLIGSLSGTVVNPSGGALANISVEVRLESDAPNPGSSGPDAGIPIAHYSATTDAQGNFSLSIDDISEEEDAKLTFSGAGYLKTNETILLVPGEDQSINITMQPMPLE